MDTYSLAFSASPLGPKRYQAAIHYFDNPKAAWEGNKMDYQELGIGKLTFQKFEKFRNAFDIGSYVARLINEKVEFVSFLDKAYPKTLKKLENPPIGLFCRGNLDLLNEKLFISVVGTRKITTYGRSITQMLVEGLVEQGVCIVSGLALGVDACAHRAALERKGKTIAVLGCGVDCCLPSENYRLYSDIIKSRGLVVSEYALSVPPNKGTFPARNRIVAAISHGVLVTEAAEDSGSLITANYAFGFRKKVFAVPGQVGASMSMGALKLLKQGAKMVTEVDDILSELQIAKSKQQKVKSWNLTHEEEKIVKFLQSGEMTIDEISKLTKIPTTQLMTIISGLEIRMIINSRGGRLSIK